MPNEREKITTHLIGAQGEYRVIGKIMKEGILVYTPVIDVEGIDCIIHNQKGRLIKLQIKTRNLNGKSEIDFIVRKLKVDCDYFVCCYLIDVDELWVIPSPKFLELANTSSEESTLVLNLKSRRALAQYREDLGIGLLKLGPYKDRTKNLK